MTPAAWLRRNRPRQDALVWRLACLPASIGAGVGIVVTWRFLGVSMAPSWIHVIVYVWASVAVGVTAFVVVAGIVIGALRDAWDSFEEK